MFKLFGAFLIMSASLLFGFKKNADLRERKKSLSELRLLLKAVESKIRCMCLPLDKCFEESGNIFFEASVLINGGLPPSEAVKRAADKAPFLKEGDRRLFYSFAKGLCADDCTGQLANLSLLDEGLIASLADAENELSTKGKLFLQGSVLFGAAAVILML